jgi:hypothetical protein
LREKTVRRTGPLPVDDDDCEAELDDEPEDADDVLAEPPPAPSSTGATCSSPLHPVRRTAAIAPARRTRRRCAVRDSKRLIADLPAA